MNKVFAATLIVRFQMNETKTSQDKVKFIHSFVHSFIHSNHLILHFYAKYAP